MTNRKQKVILKIGFALFLLVLPSIVNAAGLVPCGGEGENFCGVADVFVLAARLTNWLLRMAGLYAVYKIVNSSWSMIISQGNEEALSTAKKTQLNAILGVCLAMMAYMIVNTAVNLILLQGVKECQIDWTNPLSYLDIKDNKCSAVSN